MKSLPEKYKKYFWDCDFNSLDWNDHKEYILKRLLSFGNLEAIKLILKEFSHQEIKIFIQTKGSFTLSRTNYLFWKRIVKHEELWG